MEFLYVFTQIYRVNPSSKVRAVCETEKIGHRKVNREKQVFWAISKFDVKIKAGRRSIEQNNVK